MSGLINSTGSRSGIISGDIYAHLDGNVWTNPLLDELAQITVSQAPDGLNKVFRRV